MFGLIVLPFRYSAESLEHIRTSGRAEYSMDGTHPKSRQRLFRHLKQHLALAMVERAQVGNNLIGRSMPRMVGQKRREAANAFWTPEKKPRNSIMEIFTCT